MLKHIGNLIFSSISMAFLVILSWSIAYAYGWGQSYFYGYPWWYVDVHISNIARSTGYVVLVTLILVITTLLAIYTVRKCKPLLSYRCLNILRAATLSMVVWFPIVIISFLLTGGVNPLFMISYGILVVSFTFIFKRYIEKYVHYIDKKKVMRFVKQNQYAIVIFTYIYFVLSAFVIGYFRPHFSHSFDMVEFKNKMYYVLSKYDDAIILSQDIRKNGEDFYIYRITTNVLNHIKTNQLPQSAETRCSLEH
ncbi:hypothetical protein [Pasteurella sp. PK-2025]|uniref:hypothetical protein n=1 Tax=unclassified Pasteurella TaxID=2621516 RepID=UPI003C766786